MLGSSFIANFRLTMNGPRGVITCSRGLNGSNHWILQISSLRMGREQHVPDSCNHAFCLRMREISEGTSYQMVRLVFRHFRHEPSPEFSLTLPFSGIFRGFFRVWLLLKPLSRSRSVAGVHVCLRVGAVLCACAVQCAVCCVLCVVCCENQRKQREMLPSSSSLKSHTCRLRLR